jgi:acetyltransferase-like isoleucine patch superfamily enzyme
VVVNGFAEVGAACYLASNCTITGGVKLGPQSFIGANVLVAKDTAERSVYIAEPAAALDIDSLRFLKLLRYDI